MDSYHCSYGECTMTFNRQSDCTRHIRRYHWHGTDGVRELAIQRVLQTSENVETDSYECTLASEEGLDNIAPLTFPTHDIRFVTRPLPIDERDDIDSQRELCDEPSNGTDHDFADPLQMFPFYSRSARHNDGTEGNPWSPFTTKEDFWFAWWSRTNPGLSKPRVNAFLRVLRDDTFDFRNVTFTSADKMLQTVDDLVLGEGIVPWVEGRITLTGSGSQSWQGLTVTFLYRNVLHVIKSLFARADLDIVLRPKSEVDSAGLRSFNEPWTGYRWARYQVMSKILLYLPLATDVSSCEI
jgi:hypothetical protein